MPTSRRRTPRSTASSEPTDDQKYQTRAFRRHRVNAEYIHRLLDLAAERGVPVYWLLPPLAPQLQARREQTGAEADFVRFVRSFQTPTANLTVLDARHAGYDHTLFVDPTHLDGQGAYTLSRDVADILRHDRAGRGMGTQRWVDLPAYRACPVEVALEDFEQSRQALIKTR